MQDQQGQTGPGISYTRSQPMTRPVGEQTDRSYMHEAS